MEKINFNKNKKGISAIIGYVLLIGIVVSISVFVFAYLRTYADAFKDETECPEGTSIYLKGVSCSLNKGELELKFILENNGRFSIDGYYIKGTNLSKKEIEERDVINTFNIFKNAKASKGTKHEDGLDIDDFYMSSSKSFLSPNEKSSEQEYYISTSEISNLTQIQIDPIKNEKDEEDDELEHTVCNNARIKRYVECK